MFQQRCIVFAGRRGLDQVELRQSVARIPEVSRKLKAAQKLLDQVQTDKNHVDLFNTLHSSDGEFSANQEVRSLLAAVVQLGLYERYARFHGHPRFLVGNTNGTSALLTIAGVQTFEDMISQSQLAQSLMVATNDDNPLSHPALTLSGMSLEEFGIYSRGEEKYENLEWGTQDCYQILCQLHQDHQVDQFVHVGPGQKFRENEMGKRKIYEFLLGNSVELDPILNSFWLTA